MQDADETIREACWVSLRYRLFDSLGEPLEEGERELTYLHGGFGHLLEKLEAALAGRRAGDRLSLYLEPEDAFGDYDAQLVHLASRAALPEVLEEGMSFEGLPGEDGDDRIYTVTDIAGDTVVLDGNHPLAGIAVRFDLEVCELRPASDEEIADETARMTQ